MGLAFGATLAAIAFVPVLCILVAARGQRWISVVICCAIGSALGAVLLAWLAANYGPQLIEQLLPRAAHSEEWLKGVRWVNEFGYLALFAFAALPLSQTPVLIVCALLGMSTLQIFLAVLIGKFAKYWVSATAAAAATRRITAIRNQPP